MHIHLIPRTKKLGTNSKGKYRPWEVAAWNIANLQDKGGFQTEYRVRDRNGREINENKIIKLMQYLRESLTNTR